MRPGTRALACALVATAIVVPDGGRAHTRSASYSVWNLEGQGARVRARVSRLDLSRLGLDPTASRRDSARVGKLLAESLGLRAGDEPCAVVREPTPTAAAEGFVAYEWALACPAGASLTVESRLLLDVAPSHLHFARLNLPGGGVVERVLSEAEPAWEMRKPAAAMAAKPTVGTSLGSYIILGIEHILSGWDHLAFVMALLLLAGTVGEVATLVTAFTLAHSVTLALAVLGVVHPEAHVVEALIGFSIALVAAENVWILGGRDRAVPLIAAGGLAAMATFDVSAVPRAALFGLALFSFCHFALLARSSRPARLRAAVAFAFGLIHGFGFAGIMAELELPTGRLAPALFGFNLGVEIGQLAVVAVAWPLLRAIGRVADGRWGRLVAEGGSAAICGLGLFWFVTRSF